MGYGAKDEENPVSEEENEIEPERRKLKPPDEEAGDMELTKIPVKTRDAAYPEVIVGHSDPLIKSHHLKYMLFGFNFCLTILSLAVLAIAIWIRVDPEFWEYETTLDVDNFYAVCHMFIIGSLVILAVGFLGCFGAATERRWLLIAYIGIFGIIFLLQLAALVIMWMAPYNKTITKELEKQIQKQIDERETDDSARIFMDFIQGHLECCGATGFKDYHGNPLPNSCQNVNTGNTYDGGCVPKMLTYLRIKAAAIGGLAMPILLLQLVAMIASGCLIKSLEVESRYFM